MNKEVEILQELRKQTQLLQRITHFVEYLYDLKFSPEAIQRTVDACAPIPEEGQQNTG